MLGIGAAGPRGEAAPAATPSTSGLTEPQARAVLVSIQGLGPVGFGDLLRAFGSGLAILERARRPGAVADFARIGAGLSRRTFDEAVASEIVSVAEQPDAVLRRIEAAGVEILTLEDDRYPARLRAIEMPPHVLFVDGAVASLAAGHAVAVVGTRRPTEEGRLIAARIGAAIAKAGGTVVSGLAVGIDGAAHAGVTAEGGVTVAVLGSGHGRLYPRAHQALARSIVAGGGAVVSEQVPDAAPTGGSFPRRNRIISGLSDATIVVEAAAKSGALITAAWALEQGRECYFVPGSINAPQSAGCLAWLREYAGGVRIVAGIPELIEDLGLLRASAPSTSGRPSLEAELIELGATARGIALELVRGRGTVDELVSATGHPVATALGALTLLELRGLAASAYGRYRPAGRLAAAAAPPRATTPAKPSAA